MKRLVGQIGVALAVLGMLAAASPVRADGMEPPPPPDPCADVLNDTIFARDLVICGVTQKLNKCSVDASVLYLNSAIAALQAGDKTTALTRVRAAHLCLCRESRELNCASGVCVPFQTLAGLNDLAVGFHTVDSQFHWRTVCDLLKRIIDCLD